MLRHCRLVRCAVLASVLSSVSGGAAGAASHCQVSYLMYDAGKDYVYEFEFGAKPERVSAAYRHLHVTHYNPHSGKHTTFSKMREEVFDVAPFATLRPTDVPPIMRFIMRDLPSYKNADQAKFRWSKTGRGPLLLAKDKFTLWIRGNIAIYKDSKITRAKVAYDCPALVGKRFRFKDES